MTQDEMRKVLAIVQSNYPYMFEHMDDEQIQVYLDTWMLLYGKEDKRLLQGAVAMAIAENQTNNVPPHGVIREKLIQLAGLRLTEPESAWEDVRWRWRNLPSDDYRDAKKVWESLDETTRKIYSPEDLVTLAFNTKPEQINSFEKPRFLKAYKEISEDVMNNRLRIAPSITALALEAKTCPLLENKS